MEISKHEDKYSCLVSGDSISKGVIYDEDNEKYVILENNYVALVQIKLKGIIYNTSRFGNTLIKGIGKLKNDILKNDPKIVFIEYGGNDCDFNWNEIAINPDKNHQPKTDLHLFEKSLIETINSLKDKAITPVLMTLPPLDADRYFKWVSKNNPLSESNILKWLGSITKIYWWQERYSSAISMIAEKTKTKLIDIRGAFLQYPDFTEFICKDGIHPNYEGHRLIANKITEYISLYYNYLLLDNQVEST
jgi:acyl-CoA thioesterase I